MARIPYPDPEKQPPEIRDRLTRLGSLNVNRMMSHAEDLMMAFSRMGTALLLKGALDPVLREAVILRIGQLCDSEYEWHQHASLARVVGMDEATLDAIAACRFDQLEPRQQVAVRLAEEIFRNQVASEATMAEAVAMFTHREVVELCLLAGYYIMTAGFLRSLDIEIEDTPPLGESIAAGPQRQGL